MTEGDRSMFPEQEGQLSGEPVRSLAIKCSACAGLYVAGRGLRMTSSKTVFSATMPRRPMWKTNRLGTHIQDAPRDEEPSKQRVGIFGVRCRTVAA